MAQKAKILITEWAISYLSTGGSLGYPGSVSGSPILLKSPPSWLLVFKHACFVLLASVIRRSYLSARYPKAWMYGPECSAVAAIQLRMRNANSDPRQNFANFHQQMSKKKCKLSIAKEFASDYEWFAKEIVKSVSLLWNFLTSGSLQRKSLAIANAMAWCTQVWTPGRALQLV